MKDEPSSIDDAADSRREPVIRCSGLLPLCFNPWWDLTFWLADFFFALIAFVFDLVLSCGCIGHAVCDDLVVFTFPMPSLRFFALDFISFTATEGSSWSWWRSSQESLAVDS